MWIEEIFVAGFGAFREFSLNGLGPGLTVILGPNEAGKSTLLEFVRAVFFGFRKKAGRTNTYEPALNGLRGGRLVVRAKGRGRLRIQRSETPGSRGGILTITDDEGEALDPSDLPFLGSGLDRTTFETLFAVDLDGIRQLDQEALKRRIVAAVLGSCMVNPLEVIRRVDERLKEIGKRSDRDTQCLWGIQEKLRGIDKRLKILSDRPEQYSRLKEEHASINRRLAERALELRTKGASLRSVERLLAHEKDWNELSRLDRELGHLSDAVEFPADGVLRLEQALTRREEVGGNLQETRQGFERLRAEHEALMPDPMIVAHFETLEELARDTERLSGLPAEIEKQIGDIYRSRAALDEEIACLGPDWDFERVVLSEPSFVVERQIRSLVSTRREFASRVRDLSVRIDESSDRWRRLQDGIERKADEIRRIEAACEGFLDETSRRRLIEWRELRARIRDLRDRLAEKGTFIEDLASRQAGLGEDLDRLNDRPPSAVSAWTFGVFAALLLTGSGTMVFAAMRSADASAYLFGGIACALTALLVTAVRWKSLQDRERRRLMASDRERINANKENLTRKLLSAEYERRGMHREVEALNSRAAETAASVLGNPRATEELVAEAEARSAAAAEPFRRKRLLEDALTLERADLEAEEERRNGLQKALAESEGDIRHFQEQWAAFLARHDLEATLDPDSATEFVARLRTIKERALDIRTDEARLKEIQAQWHRLVLRVCELASEMGRECPEGFCPLATVRQWRIEEKEARTALLERKALSRTMAEQQVRLSVLVEKMGEVSARIASLLRASGAIDEETFRILGARHADYRVKDQERRIVAHVLMSGLGFDDETEMRESLSKRDWEGERRAAEELRDEVEQLSREARLLSERAGRVSAEIEALEADDETALLLSEREQWIARLHASARSWLTLRMAGELLEQTLRVFESERRPRILARSSELLESMTGGAYRKILLPFAADSVHVERSDGTRLDERFLSRATLEQTYLCLRLAHVESSQRGEPVGPLLMDDILVNFDQRRIRFAADALSRFSEDEGVQILFFTCHPHVADLFPAAALRVELNAS